MRDLREMMRKHLVQPEGYVGAAHSDQLASEAGVSPDSVIRLNANENPYDPLPELTQALVHLPIHEYPDQEQVRMRDALSSYTGRPAGQIIAGSGSDEIIELLVKLFIEPGETIIDCPPTFGMYEFCARIAEAELITVDRSDDWEIDTASTIAAIVENSAKILFVASPNNPTGNAMPVDQAKAILDTGVVLVVDETYYEFCGESLADLLDDYENLVILRSFSKWAGIAGLRIGYAIASELIVGHLMTIKQPFNVNIAAEAAAIAALDNLEPLEDRISTLVSERGRIEQAIDEMSGISYSPSVANFLLLHFDGLTGDEAYRRLASKGIFARQFSSPRLSTSIRLSVGTPEQNDIVLDALRGIHS